MPADGCIWTGVRWLAVKAWWIGGGWWMIIVLLISSITDEAWTTVKPWYSAGLAYVIACSVWPFVLYESFPRLTAGVRGCAYYWQRLTTVTVSLVRTLSSRRWRLKTFQRNKGRPRIVAAQNEQRVAAASDRRNTVLHCVIAKASLIPWEQAEAQAASSLHQSHIQFKSA